MIAQSCFRNDCKKLNSNEIVVCSSEGLIKGAADLIAMDYKEAGYEYIIIDDCWKEEKRDPQTNELVANGERFPGGMQALAEYVSRYEFSNLDKKPNCFLRRFIRKDLKSEFIMATKSMPVVIIDAFWI